jgi:CRP/FNR family cyclic AMP-dependent transcriptional regulator
VSPIHLFQHASDAEDVSAGFVLFNEGEPGETMFVVLDGAVDVKLCEKLLETVHSGGLVGEMALIDDAPRSASAVAAEPSRILEVDKKRFTYLVQEHPTFALQVMEEMAARLRRANVGNAS